MNDKDEKFNLTNEEKKASGTERRKGQFDVISWLLRQSEYAKYAERNKLSLSVKAGEIYEVDFGINVNAEFSYRHYALVLADSSELNPLALVCPLKSNTKGPHPASDINLGFINALDSDHESLAVINQIRTIDKLRIFKRPLINRRPSESNHQFGYGFGTKQFDDKETYRLEQDKFVLVQKALGNYIQYGQIDPNKEK